MVSFTAWRRHFIQVPASEVKLLQQSLPDARLLMLPGMNHVLKDVKPKDMQDNLRAYKQPKRPLAPGLVDGIAEFVSK